MEDADGNVNFAFFLTMAETLELVMHHCEEAKDVDDIKLMEVHLKMASRAMRCALEVFGSHLLEIEEKNEHIHRHH